MARAFSPDGVTCRDRVHLISSWQPRDAALSQTSCRHESASPLDQELSHFRTSSFFFFFFPRYGRLQQLSLIFVSHVSVLASLRSIPPTASPLIYLVSTIPSLAGRPAYFSLRLDRRHLVPADIYPILDFTLKYSVQELFRLFFEYPRLRYANHGVQRRIALGPSSLQETTGRER